MNNERGFFTIVGLCFLLVIALAIRAIQDTEKNYFYETSDFQEELELQNAADGGLTEAAEKIHLGLATIPDAPKMYVSRSERQYPVEVSQPNNIQVEVYGEYGDIYRGSREYLANGNFSDTLDKDGDSDWTKKGIILISVASRENNFGVKKFSRKFGYILEDEQYKKIYYLDTVSNKN